MYEPPQDGVGARGEASESVRQSVIEIIGDRGHQDDDGGRMDVESEARLEDSHLVGWDERNLIDIPFALLSDYALKGLAGNTIETRWVAKNEHGSSGEFFTVVVGSEEYGLPTFQAEEVYLACLQLTRREGPLGGDVQATKADLLRALHWPGTGDSYKQLLRAMDQLAGVRILTNHWWSVKKHEYETVDLHIIDNYTFPGSSDEPSNRGKRLPGAFVWSNVLMDSLKTGFVETLNTDEYHELRSNVSKRLYRIANKYSGQGTRMDVVRLARDRLWMRVGKYASHALQQLSPAIAEVNGTGLATIRVARSQTGSGQEVIIEPPRQDDRARERKEEPGVPRKSALRRSPSTLRLENEWSVL